MSKMSNKVLLIIRDGRGYRKSCELNAICEANTPNTDKLMENYPNILIDASGEAVGLPQGYQGNSEVGHMTIGSGRILFQSLVRINKSIDDGSFFENKSILDAIENCKKNNSSLHLIALLQNQGVHAHIDHLFATLDLCKKQNFSDVKIHAISDGRDAPVTESLIHLNELNNKIASLGFGEIVSISGRYFTMDRNQNRDRTKKSYDCIMDAKSETSFVDVVEYIKKSHENNITDEFIVPTCKVDYTGIVDGDSIFFLNFRTDRPRQLSQAILDDGFNGFERIKKNVCFVSMTHYYDGINSKIVFPDISLDNILGEVLSKNGKKQLRISETEKYAHVTFFFNGQEETPFVNEDRNLIQSPDVETYDLKPEMSVYEITKNLNNQLKLGDYDFVVVNLVNGDMVGHTGIPDAVQKAVSAVDDCVKKIVDVALDNDYISLITADHGNAEDQNEQRRTSHTTNPVPFILVSKDSDLKLQDTGGLQDIAPTVLDLMGIDKPSEITGMSLIK